MNQSVTIDVKNAAELGAPPTGLWQKRLSILLVVQLLLIVGIFAYKQNMQPSIDAQPLLGITTAEIDRMLISDADNKAELKKTTSGWQLPGLQQLPVDQEKLVDVLQKLDGTKLTWPVTTTRSAHERFEVAGVKFQRRIELFQGDTKKADLFLGTSPGFKKVHVRQAEADNVYAVELTTFEFPGVANDWLQKDLLAVKDVEMVKGPDYQLQKTGADWSFVATDESGDEQPKVAKEKVTQLTNALGSLQIQEPASSAPQEGETISLSVKSPEGEFNFDFVKAADTYFVKRNDRDIYFKLSQYEYERIAKLDKASLTDDAADVDTEAADSSAAITSDAGAIADAALRNSGLKTDSNN
jgi:hypothetical protein